MAKATRKSKIPIAPGGPLKECTLADIVSSDEKMSTYDLSDGSQVRLKTVVTEIWRIDGEYDPEGNPLYTVKASGSMTVIAPDELKKQ